MLITIYVKIGSDVFLYPAFYCNRNFDVCHILFVVCCKCKQSLDGQISVLTLGDIQDSSV